MMPTPIAVGEDTAQHAAGDGAAGMVTAAAGIGEGGCCPEAQGHEGGGDSKFHINLP
jgi:hypothetical protein